MKMNSRDSAIRGASVLIAFLTLTACSSSPPASTDAPAPSESTSESSSVTVIQPGEPGEEATTGGPVEVAEAGFTHADVAFMQMMIPHHAQALEMAELAKDHAASRAVRVLAGRIRAAQGPEIIVMSTWLEERDLDVPQPDDDPAEFDHGQHGHDPMMGMLTASQMDDLAAARGAQFDTMFLRSMIRHHQGALDMAATVAADGEDLRVAELAADIDVTQRVEIERMREMLGAQG